jgi:cell division protein FtsQ
MKNPLRIILIVALLILIVLAFHIVRLNSTMRGIETTVEPCDRPVLIDEPDVDSIIIAAYPNLRNTKVKNIKRREVVSLLRAHPYILDAKVRLSAGGKLLVDVTPRQPVLRMFYQGNEFYISREGTCMPLAPGHYCHLIVGNTLWEEPLLRNVARLDLADTANHRQPASLQKMWTLALFLHDNPHYGDIFDQMCINSDGDLCLIPKLGITTVVIGDTTRIAEKFENLWAFIDQGISQLGWNTYTEINLKYRGQVVCTKADKFK